jgi:hypothetical protein
VSFSAIVSLRPANPPVRLIDIRKTVSGSVVRRGDVFAPAPPS